MENPVSRRSVTRKKCALLVKYQTGHMNKGRAAVLTKNKDMIVIQMSLGGCIGCTNQAIRRLVAAGGSSYTTALEKSALLLRRGKGHLMALH